MTMPFDPVMFRSANAWTTPINPFCMPSECGTDSLTFGS